MHINSVNQKLTSKTQQALQAHDRLVFTPFGMVPRWFGAVFLLAGLAAVVAGICDVLGVIHGEGSVWVAFVVGALFALVGYGLTFYRSRLEFDLTLSRWRQEQGVPPFGKVRAGVLSDWNYAQFDREMRTVQGEGGATTFAVWTVKLRAEGDRLPPLPVTGFEFPCQGISRAEALALARELAQKLNLPLREDDVAALTPLPSVSVAPLRRPSLATVPPPPSSRIGVETLPDGTASITLAGSPWKALPALLPLGFVGVFIWRAEQSHREFLAHVSADSRAFFSHSPSPMLFFSPLLLFAALPFLFLLSYHLTRRHIRITAEQITMFSSLFGRQFTSRSVPLNAVRGIEWQQSTAASGSVAGSGIEVSAQARQGTDLVLVSDQTDLKLGATLTLPEREWLYQVLRIHLGLEPDRATFLPPETPRRQEGGSGVRDRRRTRGASIARFALPLLLGITLLNSYGGGLTLVRQWRDSAGRRFVSSNSLWKSHTICVDAQGEVTESQVASTPFSSSTKTTGTLPESEGDTSDSRWRLLLGANAEAALSQARPRSVAPETKPANLTGSKSALHHFQYYYNSRPQGQRYWRQISPMEWQERYDTGMTMKFRFMQRTKVEGAAGITVQKQDGTGLLVFIPDRGSHKMRLRCRYEGQPGWTDLGEMTHID